jgi:hypothetical protein
MKKDKKQKPLQKQERRYHAREPEELTVNV